MIIPTERLQAAVVGVKSAKNNKFIFMSSPLLAKGIVRTIRILPSKNRHYNPSWAGIGYCSGEIYQWLFALGKKGIGDEGIIFCQLTKLASGLNKYIFLSSYLAL